MKMYQKLGLIVILVLVILVAIAALILYVIRGRLSEERINQLSFGMIESDVLSLLGKPNDVSGREPRNIYGLKISNIISYNYKLDEDTTLSIFFSDRGELASVLVDEKGKNPLFIMKDAYDPIGTTPWIDLANRTFGCREPRFEISDVNGQVSPETLNQIERGISQTALESFLGKANSINEDGDHVYRFSENYDITIEYNSDGLISVNLMDSHGQLIQSLLKKYDPPNTRIFYDPVAAAFSKEYGPVYLEQTIGSFQSDALNQIRSGMSRENVIDVFGLPDEESGNGVYYQINENQRLCFVFYSSLSAVALQDYPMDSTFYIRDLLDDRDPVGTRIQYDLETGYFSKILPE